MAYGYKSYEQAPEGGYTFTTDDDRKVHLWGTEADQMAQAIDREKPYELPTPTVAKDLEQNLARTRMQGALAMAGGGGTGNTPESRVDAPTRAAGGMPSQQNPDLYGKADPRLTSVTVSPSTQLKQPSPQGAPEPVETVAEKPQEFTYGKQGDAYWQARGYRSARDAWARENTRTIPGTPGNNPEKKIATGMMVPSTSAVSISREGAPVTEEELQARADNEIDYRLAMQARFRADEEAAKAQAQDAAARAEEARNRKAVEQARFQAAQRYADDAWSEVETASQEARQKRIDPNRFFADRGTFGVIVSAIAQGLGAYSAGMLGGPNYAQQIIDNAINRDIEAQKAEMANSQAAADNALSRLTKRLGDRDVAESVLRSQMQAVTDAEKELWQADLTSEQSKSAFQVWLAERDRARIEEKKALMDQAAGKQLEQVNSRFEIPTAGTPSRTVLVRPSDMAKNEAEIAKSVGETQYGMSPEKLNEKVQWAAEKLFAYEKASEQEKQFGTATGVVQDERGNWHEPDGWTGAPGIGFGVEAIDTLRDDAAAVVRAKGKYFNAYKNAITGAAASEDEVKRLERSSLPSTDSQIVKSLNENREALEAERRAALAGVPREAWPILEQRLKELRENRNQKSGTPVKVKEF